MNDWQTLTALWNWSSPVWIVATAILAAYLAMFRRSLGARVWFLLAGLAILILAYVSPLGVFADGYLFSAHMIQHLLLLLIVPLFLILSVPRNISIPHAPRDATPHAEREGYTGNTRFAIVAWLCGLGAMWFWHVPSLCSASTLNSSLGAFRDATFLLAGLAFWWPIFAPFERQRLAAPNAVVYLFSACLGCTLLGIYITFTTISVCPAFANTVDRLGVLTMLYDLGLTPAADQHLGGLLMWVPPCSLYVSAIIAVLARWYKTIDEISPRVSLVGAQLTANSKSYT